MMYGLNPVLGVVRVGKERVDGADRLAFGY